MSRPTTAGELIRALSQVDPDTPLIASTHFDNDIGYGANIDVSLGWFRPGDGAFWTPFEPDNYSSFDEVLPTGALQGLILTARGS